MTRMACAEIFAARSVPRALATARTRSMAGRGFAFAPELFVDHALLSWIRGRLSVGALVPLHAETFSVTGVGLAYATPAVGGLASLALEIVTP